MKKCYRILSGFTISLALLFVTNGQARAEGSLQLNPNDDGKRTYLEYKTKSDFGLSGLSTLYVVARAGETITLAGSILNSYDNNDIVVTSVKDGRSWSFDVTNNVGFIANRAAEKAGPYYPATGAKGNRYVPLTFTVPFDGIYSVVFHTMSDNGNIPEDSNPSDQRCDAQWYQTYGHNVDHSQGDGIAAWDISVFDAQDNLKTGRMFAPFLVISDGDIGKINGADGIYAMLYLLTHDGYLYRINTNGFDPDGITFYSDNVGLIDNGSNQTLYKHTNNTNVRNGDVSIVYPNCDLEYDRMTHRIFFNEPDNSITDILNIATTPQDYAQITCDKITFRGNRSNSDNEGLANTGMGGVFTVSFSKACTYELIIDSNRDGIFDGSDIILMDAASAGENVLLWNGKDSEGNVLASGTYEVQLKVHAGELHLPMSDLEDNINGYELYLSNTLASGSSSFSDDRQYRIWYDGSDYQTFNGTSLLIHSDVVGEYAGNNTGTIVHEPSPYVVKYGEMLSSKIGSDGKGGFLYYSNNSAYNRGYGNNRILDVWTYSTSSDALYGTFTISTEKDAYGYVTGTAYFDKDMDGTYDSGENPAGGLTLILCDKNKKVMFDANGDTIKTTTNYGGKYAFAGVPYTVGTATSYYVYVNPDMADGNAYKLTNKNVSGQYIPISITTNETYKQDIFGIGDYDVKVSITANKTQIYSGDAITFTVKVTNISTSTTVTDVYVNIPQLLPENISGDEVATVQSKSSDTYFEGIWTVGSLKPSETHTLTLTVHPISATDATFTQSATAVVNNASGDCNEENNTASVNYKIIHVEKATLIYNCNGCGETITYDINNVELFNAGKGSISNKVIELPSAFVRDCFTFIGWGKDQTTNVTHSVGDKLTDVVGGDELHMYAIWDGDDITYTVNHYAMVDGVKTNTKVAASQTLTAQVGDVILPEAVSVTGYTYAEADEAATLECGVNTVFNVYYEPKDVKITWYVNAGAYLTETQKYGTSVSAKAINNVATITDEESTAYEFIGWSLQKNGSVITDWSTQVATENVIYYAVTTDLTISAPNSLVYDGVQKKATTTISDDWKQTVGDIYYVGTNGTSYSKTTVAPINAGTYIASVTSGKHNISVTYTIAKADITPMVTIANWREGNTPSTPSVSNNIGNGIITYTYYTNEDCTTKTTSRNSGALATGGQPTKAGTYYLVASIAATTNYNAATAKTSFMITTYTVTAPTPRTLTYTGYAQQLANAGSVNNNYYIYYRLPEDYTYTYDITTLKGTNAGTYTLYYAIYSYSNGYKLEAGPSFITITIAKAASSCTVKGNTLTYNATNQSLVTATAVNGGTIYYRLSSSDEWSTTIPTATAAGSYTIYYYVKGDSNHEDSDVASVTATIAKANVKVVAENNTKIYGDADPALSYVVTGLYGSDILLGSLERVAGEDVGTYDIKIGSLDGGTNYTISSYTGATFTITKADGVIPIVTANELTYNGTAQKLVTGTTDSGTIMYSTDNSTWITTIPTAKNAGTYTIYYYVKGDKNHSNSSVSSVSVNIAQKPIVIVANNVTKEYGKTDPTLTYTVTGLVGSDVLTGKLTRTSGEDIGEYAISQGTLTCSDNYIIDSFVGATFIITKAKATVTAPKSKTLTYTGTAQTLATSGTATGGTLYYSLSSTSGWSTTIPTGTNVGSYTIYYYVKGDSNHSDTEVASIVSIINAKSLIINAISATKVYGAPDPEFTYTVSGLLGDDELVGSLSRKSGENVGTYALTQGTLTAGANYSISFTSADFTITKASITALTVVMSDWVYGSSAKTPVVTGNTDNGAITYTYYTDASLTVPTSSANGAVKNGGVPANVGTYYVKATVAATANYNAAEASTSFSITKAKATVTAPKYVDLTYTGTAQNLLTEGATSNNGIVYYSFDNISWSVTIPSATNVGSYKVYYYVKGDDNHSNSEMSSVVVNIKAVVALVNAPIGRALVYNTTEQELIYAGATDCGTLYYSLNKTDWETSIPTATNAGSYTIYYYVEADANHKNTEVSSVVSSIVKADLLLSVSIENWVYESTPSIPVVTGNTGNGTITYTYYTDASLTVPTSSANGAVKNGGVPANVGTYYVKATVAATANYNAAEASTSFNITPEGLTVVSPIANQLTYNGEKQELVTAGFANGGTLYYRLSSTEQWLTTIPTGIEAGDYVVYYYVKGDADHYSTDEATINVTISKAQATCTEPVAAVVVYNGENQLLLTDAGIAMGGTIYYSLDAISWSTNIPMATEVGSYTVYYYVEGNDNYNGTDIKYVTATIVSEQSTAVNPTTRQLVYNGNLQELIVAGSSADGIIKYRLSETAEWSTTIPAAINAGDYIVYVKLFGDANHDDHDMPSLNVTIAKAVVDIPTASSNTYVYDGTEKTYSIAINELYAISNASHTDVGTYSVTVSLVDTNNYEWADGTTTDKVYTMVIKKAQVEIPAKSYFIYDNDKHTYLFEDNEYYTHYGYISSVDEYKYIAVVTLTDPINTEWTDGTTEDKTYEFIDFHEDQYVVQVPDPDNTEFIYDGTPKTYFIAPSEYYEVTNNVQTLPGVYTVVITLKSPNYIWSNGYMSSLNYTFVIHSTEAIKVAEPNTTHTHYEYNGEEQTIDIPESEHYTIENGKHTDAGTYEVVISLNDKVNSTWEDGTTDDKIIVMILDKAKVSIPAKDTTTYYYTTHQIIYQIAESSKYTVSGNVQTEVGSYTVEVSLADKTNYEWTDGTSEDKQYEFVINEADKYEDSFIIRLWNDVLTIDNSSGHFTSYQWYKNGKLIEGATSQYYNDPDGIDGTYYCIVNGSATIGPKTYEGQSTISMQAYGATRRATIKVNGLVDGDSDVVIYDVMGKRVETLKVSAVNNVISVNLPQGLYLVQLNVDNVPTTTSKITVK